VSLGKSATHGADLLTPLLIEPNPPSDIGRIYAKQNATKMIAYFCQQGCLSFLGEGFTVLMKINFSNCMLFSIGMTNRGYG